MCTENKCKKIVSKSATGADYVIEGNRKVWYTDDGNRFVEVNPQYRGPVWGATNDGMMCPTGFKGSGLGFF